MVLCDDASNNGSEPFDLTDQDAIILGAQPASDYTVTYHSSLADAASSTGALVSPYDNITSPQPIYVRVELSGDASCFNVTADPAGEFDLIVNGRDDAGFTAVPTCDGSTATVTGDPGGTFSFSPVPGDGATIDGATGTVANGAPGATYTIEYTTVGICPDTSSQTVTVTTADDPGFTMVPTCDGGTVDSVATPGGTYGFNPLPTDTAAIDAATGTVTNGAPGASYVVEYTTNGACPATGTFNLTVTPTDDPAFTMVPTCDGATVDSVATPGGTYALSPMPGDGAMIDMASGDITNGTSGASYTVEYTTNGACPSTSATTVTVETTDDATFTMAATCDGGTVASVATPGGAYAFDPVPTDAATIDPATGTVTNGTPGATYTIGYGLAGACPSSTTVDLTVLATDDASFAYMPTCDGAVVDSVAAPGGTYSFDPAPTDGAVIDAMTGEITNGTPGAAYTVDYATNGTCPSSSTVTVTASPLPTVIAPTALEVCDDGTPDGFTAIDLTVKDNEISGGNPAYGVTYHLTQADADTAMGPLADPYTNISNPQTVFVRVEDTGTGCYDTTALELIVQQAPVTNAPSALEHCDPDSDGFGSFTLSDADAQVTGGATGLTVTYHETMADALNNVNVLASPYSNIVVDMQTIYVRVESGTIATDCASFEELVLVVNPTPQITDPTALEVCDDDGDGFAVFDLRAKDPEILNALDADAGNDLDPAQYTVTYHEAMADAEAGTNAIAAPNAYTNTVAGMQVVWVRAEDTANGCYTVTDLELIVNPLPVLVQPAPLELCDVNDTGDGTEDFTLEDANAQVLNGQTGITLSYYSTQAGADTADASLEIFTPYTNTVNAQTVYIRAEDSATGCASTITLDLRVNPVPSPVAPMALGACDDDNDGFYALFDLDAQSAAIINGEPDTTISYHETQDDAQTATNPLTSPYTNIVQDMQTVYARAENGTTGCFTIVELPLVVQPSPVVPLDIGDYVVCDGDGDGFAQFDLDGVVSPQIFTGGQTAADFVLTYHTTQLGADSGNGAIVNTGNYTNADSPQTLYIRLEGNANGCVRTGSFDIRVESPPVLDPDYDNELSQCDGLDAGYMEANDGFTAFDLTVEDAEITDGNNSWAVAYYETMAGAQSGTGAIADPSSYTNTVDGPQTLYVRVTDNDTGCSSFTTVTIRVLPNPSPSPEPADLVLCDDTNAGDMLESFDLTQNEAFIINGEAGVTLSYYTDQGDAIAASNAIADPTAHSNEDPDSPGTGLTPQTIYVRVTNGDDPTGLNGTGCYSLVSFDLRVDPLPEVVPVEDYIICELSGDVSGFDLETVTPAVLNGQDPAIFSVSYHESLAEAQMAMNALGSPYTNTSNPQTIYVNITNTVTGCGVATLSFGIEVQRAAQANPDGGPMLYALCDDNMEFDGDPGNDSVAFDLSSQDASVLDGQDPMDYTVSYYASQADADAALNPLPSVYTNVSNPQVVIVRVDNDTMVDDGTGGMVDGSICYGTAELTLRVDPVPAFDLEDTYLVCADADGTEVVDPPVMETGLDPAQYTFQWSYGGADLAGETGPSLVPADGGSYTVVVTDVATMCSSSDTALVEVGGPPELTAGVATLAFADQHEVVATASSTVAGSVAVYEFSLDGGSWQLGTQNADGSYSYTFTGVGAGTRTVAARDINGCGEATVEVLIVDYPLYFTPNGDSYHDTWNITAIAGQPGARIFIFDRYGKLLKQISPAGRGWDGTYNGRPMPSNDYWFTVEYTEPGTDERNSFRAHFTLKR